ncbi:MAG: hypothetical protein ACI4S1_09980 [Roseburia sp.]
MKKKIAVFALLAAMVLALSGCASWSRTWKSFGSDITGGLNRTVTVYSYDGDVLGQWSGKFDVSESENETFFDVGGKRVIIQGGIVINEENG